MKMGGDPISLILGQLGPWKDSKWAEWSEPFGPWLHQEVQPPQPGGATAWAVGLGGATAPAKRLHRQSSSSELCQAMQPPSSVFELWQSGASAWAQSRALPGDAFTKLSLRALAEWCISLSSVWSSAKWCNHQAQISSSARWCNHQAQSSSSARWCNHRAQSSSSGREKQSAELSLRALPGGATSPVERCNRLIPEFWDLIDLIVLSSNFELGWGL